MNVSRRTRLDRLIIVSSLLFCASAAWPAALADCGEETTTESAYGSLSARMKPSPGGVWNVRVGEGRPLLFIHGWTMDHRDELLDYEPLIQSRGGWRRIYVDLPGMGKSAATRVQDQDDMLRLLLQFIDEELGREPFAIAGTSAGAYLARAVAAKRRDQVIGMVLRMPLIEPADAARNLKGIPELVAQQRTERSVANVPAIVIDSDCYREALARKNALRVEPAQALANRKMLDPIRNDPRRYALSAPIAGGETAMPVLIMSGREDRSVGYRDAWRLVEQYSRATYVAVDRAEHGFPIDRINVALFAALVNDWLDRTEEYTSGRETKRR
jgi:pimeloyl-ACP methyl ester carboxylesterase